MTFNDIFKSSFLDRIDAVPPLDAIIALALACALGLFIVLIYKKTSTNVMHSTSFEATLVALTLITTLVILAVSSNVLLSLGMVGALSIVRFRTPVKEPMDIVFLFWCIAVGIVLAAGLLFLAVVGCIAIGLVLLIFANTRTMDRPFMLVVRCSGETVDAAERAVEALVASSTKRYVLKAKDRSAAGEGTGALDLTYEVRLKDGETAFIDALCAIEGVGDASLVSYNGDYLG